MADEGQSIPLWMIYALTTVACWGVYGVFLHTGQLGMADPQNGRYKAFFWVGIAYFLIAVLAPAGILIANGSDWAMPTKGLLWSLVAGVVGAIGAFGVLLAFGAKGHPAVVMSIIFAGAPIVNAVVSLTSHPPKGGWSSLSWQFILGILLAACGGMLVTMYKPAPAAASPGTPPAQQTDR
jgi:drug/metabolite transporter (DMT)-like permease